MPERANTAPALTTDSWVPVLSDTPLASLLVLDLGDAAAALLAQIDRPMASIAGSNGS